MPRERPRVRRHRRGDFVLDLPPEEREILRSLPGQLRVLLSSPDDSLRRLFPPAYPGDRELNEEYDRLVREDLVGHRERALRTVEETVDSTRLTEEQLTAWLGAINDLRLVLGTRLDVTEDLYDEGIDEEDPRAPAFALYFYLGWLEEELVGALAGTLDARSPG